jgi:hypothetical protein
LHPYCIILTSDVEWDSSQYDKELDGRAAFYDRFDEAYEEDHYGQYGEYCHRTVATRHTCLEKCSMMHLSLLILMNKLMTY